MPLFLTQFCLHKVIYLKYFSLNSEKDCTILILQPLPSSRHPISSTFFIYASWLTLNFTNKLATETPEFVLKTSCSQDFLGGYKSFLHRVHKIQYKFNYPHNMVKSWGKWRKKRNEIHIKNKTKIQKPIIAK